MVIREQAWKLGTSANDRICPWDPARVDESGKCKDCQRRENSVNTLILKGGADAITAGGQAEYLFEKALAPGHRALIEFPGVGHVMNHQLKENLMESDKSNKAISDFKKIIESNFVVYLSLIEQVETLQDAVKHRTQRVMNNRWDLILAFVKSAEISDFVQNTKARDAIKNLGGCLRTDGNEAFSKRAEDKEDSSECICKLTKGEYTKDNEEFLKCICELTKGKHPDCKTLTTKW
jgi:hypothetical protein